MNKRFIALSIILTILIFGVVVVASGGSQSDSLISLSYLKDVFKPSISEDIDQTIFNAYDQHYSDIEQDMDNLKEDFQREFTNEYDDRYDFSEQFKIQKYLAEDQIMLHAGSSFLLFEGLADASSSKGEIIDATSGNSSSEFNLQCNRKYIVAEASSVKLTVRSDAALLGYIGLAETIDGKQKVTPFTDINKDQWYYDAVQFVYHEKLFNGISENHFSAQGNVTRAMLATVLYRMASEPPIDPTDALFTDVSADSWYASGIAWSHQEGIVKGMGNLIFAPNNHVTRQQLAVMLYRYAQAHSDMEQTHADVLDSFKDTQFIENWAWDAMLWAVNEGIITGDTQGNLNPNGPATRAETATMLKRFME